MKKKILISAVSAIVLLAAGLLLKSNSDSRQSILLNQNIEALASGDVYYLNSCIVASDNSDDGRTKFGYYCDPRTYDWGELYDCIGWSYKVPTSRDGQCVGEVRPH